MVACHVPQLLCCLLVIKIASRPPIIPQEVLPWRVLVFFPLIVVITAAVFMVLSVADVYSLLFEKQFEISTSLPPKEINAKFRATA